MKQSFNHTNSRVTVRLGIITTVMLVFLFVVSGTVFCASAEEGDPLDDFVLEETMVTATKTGETSIQKTSISMTAIDTDALKTRKQYRLADLAMYSPNTEISDGGFPRTYIRGVGTNSAFIMFESGVASYVDGVYLERGLSGTNSLYDIERLEVLRGPQGTLYGRNATGGAINMITNKPTDELEIITSVEFGTFNRSRFDGAISGPIFSDKLRVRVSASDGTMDGYVESLEPGLKDYGDENFSTVRGTLQYLPTDNIEVILRGDYYETDTGYGLPQRMKATEPWVSIWAPGYAPPDDIYKTLNNGEHWYESEDYGFSGHVTIQLSENMTFSSITAYRHRNYSYAYDVDSSTANWGSLIDKEDIETFSQEFQLNGQNGKLDWLFAMNYYSMNEELYETWPNKYLWQGTWPWADLWDIYAGSYTDAYAVYGNLGYQITDKLKMQFGLRYSYEKKSTDGIFHINDFFPPYQNWFDIDLTAQDPHADWTALTPKFIAEYQISDDMMVFGTIAKGFKAGTLQPLNQFSPIILEPEVVWNYEVGMKSDWMNKKLRANLALFWMEYKDMQFRSATPSGLLEIQNAAESTIRGAELELVARPLKGLTLNTAISYLDAEYGSFETQTPDGVPANPEGNQMTRVPEWKIAIGAQYVQELGKIGFLTFRGDLTWRDDLYYDVFEVPESMLEAHTMVNALIRFETQDGKWSLDLYGKNLTDNDIRWTYWAEAYNGITEGPQYRPRSFGAQLTFKY